LFGMTGRERVAWLGQMRQVRGRKERERRRNAAVRLRRIAITEAKGVRKRVVIRRIVLRERKAKGVGDGW
jgi:hypothetical protein